MNFRLTLISTAPAFLCLSCASSYYNMPSNTPISDLAVVYAYSEGKRAGTIYNVSLKSINGKKVSAGKSKRWLYMKPGDYKIEAVSYKYNEGAKIAGAIAGGLAGGGSISSINTSFTIANVDANQEIQRTKIEDNNIDVKLKAGSIYVIDPVIENSKIKHFEFKTY